MPKGRKKQEVVEQQEEVVVEQPKNAFFVEFMHMGKGKRVVKGFTKEEDAREFGRTISPWMEAGNVCYPKMTNDPGVLEIVN